LARESTRNRCKNRWRLMRFVLDDDQAALVDAVRALTTRHAGASRTRALGGVTPSYDAQLDAAIDEAGFYAVFLDDRAGPLGAALVVEEVARAGGVVSAGGRGLVYPAVVGEPAPGPVALSVADHGRPVRFAVPGACLVVVGDGADARSLTLGDSDVEPVDARFGYPFARPMRLEGETLGGCSAERVRAWWRVALAVELAGTMRAALDLTLAYVAERRQFNRPIGSFQAVQHRLAECAVAVDGAHWLALEAAWSGGGPEAAAVALTYALDAAQRLFIETHQLTGAMGFTEEYDLHLWTMRIPTLRAEANALGSPGRASARERWLQGVGRG
jgi:alkylation response protein AidB-like acyl-CoA dehydrogenase